MLMLLLMMMTMMMKTVKVRAIAMKTSPIARLGMRLTENKLNTY